MCSNDYTIFFHEGNSAKCLLVFNWPNNLDNGNFGQLYVFRKVEIEDNKCTPMMNGITLFLNCMVMLVQWPWQTLDPSQPMLTNFLISSSTLKPQKSSIHLTIKEKILLEVVDKLTASTHRRMGMHLHFCTTYRWIDNHCVLSILVTSSTLIAIKGVTSNVYFGSLQQYNMHDLYHPPPWCVRPMHFGNTFDLQKLK